MTCRDIELLLLAERDGVLTADQRAALESHVATCPSCQELRTRLAEAASAFGSDAAAVALPNIEKEWEIVRGQLSGRSPTAAKRKRSLASIVWLGSSLAAAAALTLVYFNAQPQPAPQPTLAVAASPASATPADTARADYVEAGDANASTLVYVDKDSGWLVVWAVEGDAKGSG